VWVELLCGYSEVCSVLWCIQAEMSIWYPSQHQEHYFCRSPDYKQIVFHLAKSIIVGKSWSRQPTVTEPLVRSYIFPSTFTWHE
jgi:hypothetical protein